MPPCPGLLTWGFLIFISVTARHKIFEVKFQGCPSIPGQTSPPSLNPFPLTLQEAELLLLPKHTWIPVPLAISQVTDVVAGWQSRAPSELCACSFSHLLQPRVTSVAKSLFKNAYWTVLAPSLKSEVILFWKWCSHSISNHRMKERAHKLSRHQSLRLIHWLHGGFYPLFNIVCIHEQLEFFYFLFAVLRICFFQVIQVSLPMSPVRETSPGYLALTWIQVPFVMLFNFILFRVFNTFWICFVNYFFKLGIIQFVFYANRSFLKPEM